MAPKAAVVGAGPVGCLTALGLQQRGYEVVVFERRSAETFAPPLEQLTRHFSSSSDEIEDGEEEIPPPANDASSKTTVKSKSINLAISVRGLTALKFVDPHLATIVLDNAVPMHARMIHQKPTDAQGSSSSVMLDSQAYSTKGEVINSVSRLLLSRLLLDEVVSKGIEVKWESKLRSIEFGDSVTLTLDDVEQSQRTVEVVFGCDGHHSVVRTAVQKATGMKVTESTIDNAYVELHIPPKRNARGHAEYAFDPNHLHIWPRHDFMLIALANRDKSFTSTFFAPQRIFDEHLCDPRSTIAFFEEQFPDAVSAIGRDALIELVCSRTPSTLGMVRCETYEYNGQAILLGDAAHAMVPFYGQGLNCGLEDVRVMLQLIDRHLVHFPSLHGHLYDQAPSDGDAFDAWLPSAVRRVAFSEYASTRKDDIEAIQALAIGNYREMSSNVVRRSFLFRKRLDALFERHLPVGLWTSLYGNVTFSNMGYHKARQQEARQVALLNVVMSSFALGSIATTSFILARAWSWWKSR